MTRRIASIATVIPCCNEAQSIGQVVVDLGAIGVEHVVVGIDPHTTDATAEIAAGAGAIVVNSASSGYDGPCLAAIARLRADGFAGHVLFLDAGNKYDMKSIDQLLDDADPSIDLTFGVRDIAMAWHQKLGNQLFRIALRIRFGARVDDVSSVRLVPIQVLSELRLVDRQFSLPFQTVINALVLRKTICYTPIRCLPNRTGDSKVSGSKANSLRAARQMVIALMRVPHFR